MRRDGTFVALLAAWTCLHAPALHVSVRDGGWRPGPASGAGALLADAAAEGEAGAAEEAERAGCEVSPAPGDPDHGAPGQKITPFDRVFPAHWAPKCVCNPVTELTKQVVKFNAFHKTGTKLSMKGGKCLGGFFNRHNNTWAVQVRERCGHGCNASMALPPTKEVWWTRAPMDWLISNYQYHKRGDEKLRCWMHRIHREFFDVLALRPSTPHPNMTSDGTYYSSYLQRVSLEDGLFMELFRVNQGNTIGTLSQLVVAALEGEKTGNMKVCLEDFMESSKKYNETWSRVLKFSSEELEMDDKLRTCLYQKSNMGQSSHHSTYFISSVAEVQNMREIILRLDKEYFNGTLAIATEDVGCQLLP